MTNSDIKRVIGALEPESGFSFNPNRVTTQRRLKFSRIQAITALASVFLIVCVSIIGAAYWHTQNQAGVYIPQIKITANADMPLIIIYNGKIYRQAQVVEPETASQLQGVKLGRTKSGLDEASLQNSKYSDYSSNVGPCDFYSVKGYDQSFRIMILEKHEDGKTYGRFFECVNGFSVKTGADYFKKLQLSNNIVSAKYEDAESWENGQNKNHDISNPNLISEFVTTLNSSVPNLQSESANENNEYKVLMLTLKDGTTDTFYVFKDGYVVYSYPSEIAFKLDNNFFKMLWGSLRS